MHGSLTEAHAFRLSHFNVSTFTCSGNANCRLYYICCHAVGMVRVGTMQSLVRLWQDKPISPVRAAEEPRTGGGGQLPG